MKKKKRFLALMLALSISFTLIPTQIIAQNEADIDYNIPNNILSKAQETHTPDTNEFSSLSPEPEDGTLIDNYSEVTYNSQVSYEIVTCGKSGETDDDTQSAVVRFTLDNPGEQPVSFNYSVLLGSVEYKHIDGETSGKVVLSQAEPEKDVTIEIASFADNPGDYSLPNNPNTFWTGEHYFYIYCSDIQNALFDGDRTSITVPVPVESEFDYESVYDNAINAKLINFDEFDGGKDGVYSVPESRELRFTADISGDIRKMIDDGVFTHINLLQGYFINESDEDQYITYEIKAKNDVKDREAYITKYQSIGLEPNSQTPFYSDEFSQSIQVEEVNLGPNVEGNGIFNKLDFIFHYTNVTVPDAIFTSFTDEEGQYLQHQVSFSDQVSPQVEYVSIDMFKANYGDEVPVIIEFNEPVYTDDITFEVDGKILRPIEEAGTISQKVSFLYQIGDEALNAESLAINVEDIFGAVDLSGKAMQDSASFTTYIDISFEPRLTFAYCAEPKVNLRQGTSRNMSATISIPLKQDTNLSNWLISRMNEDNISTAVMARAMTAEGVMDIPLTVQTDMMRVTGLTGSFIAPENNTDEDIFYELEIFMDTGSGYKPVDSLMTTYAIPPIILVDDESDITLDYTHWPPGDQIFVNAESFLSLGYFLNVDATWVGNEYFRWDSSDESIAKIDENGRILLIGTGQVYFTLTVTNPLTDDEVIIKSRTLTVLESQNVYLYVPNGIKNQDILIGNNAKISFSTNLEKRNDLYGGSGTETEYTFTLYEAVYDDDFIKKGSRLSTEVLKSTVQEPLNSYTVPGELLTKVTEKSQYGYILEISAEDMQSGVTMTTEANIRVRQMPAKASLFRPESVFLLDNSDDFTVEFDIENKTYDTEYELVILKNNDFIPIMTVESPEPIEHVNVNISTVDSNRLLDVYTVSLKAKNPSDETWSYDSYNVYVYSSSAMRILVDGFPAPSLLTMDYDFKDGDIIYKIDFLQMRAMIGKELLRTVQIDNKSYTWYALADRVTWKVDGESVSLWYNDRRIGDDYNPVLLPGTSLMLRGDGSGSSVVTATHTLTGMTGSMNVDLKPLNDKLYLFRVYPDVSCEMVYTNGNGEKKTVIFSGEIGVYEESGIKSDVVFYPTGGAEHIYDFSVISQKTLTANQKGESSFDLYPINNVKLPLINYNVTLELFDETTGEPYTGDIIIRGGVYYNDKYKDTTTINGKLGSLDQTVRADEKGRYTLAFKPADFTKKLSASDKLRYVIEVSFPDNSHVPLYITVENDDIQAQKNSSLGVYVSEGIKSMKASSIQNGAIVLSQSLIIDGENRPITKRLYVEKMPESAILDMTVMVPNSSKDYYLGFMESSTGYYSASLFEGEFVNAYPFSDMVTLHFNCDLKFDISYMIGRLRRGEVGYYVLFIRDFNNQWNLKLSNQFEIQNLQNIPNMGESLIWKKNSPGELTELYNYFLEMYGIPGKMSYPDDSDAVWDALEILKDFSLDKASIGLEIKPTDDPLVYRGIIRLAVGSYKDSNPSGVFLGGEDTSRFSFTPGFSDIKAMAKGKFLEKAKEEMNKSSGIKKTYVGGAYIDCEVYYDSDEDEWKIRLLYGDFYIGGGGKYYRDYNSWISFVPVTSTYEFSLTAEVGLTILHSLAKDTTAYIPHLRPVFSIYGFGGVGHDYRIVAFKAGGYGKVSHEQKYLWYTDDEGLKMDGQQLKISGEVGVKYKFKICFIEYGGKHVLADYTKTWNFNEYNNIQKKIKENEEERSMKIFLPSVDFLGMEDTFIFVPVEESITFEDRSYLDAYECYWGKHESGMRMYALLSDETMEDIWVNAYPYAEPHISDDGELMIYLSDMGSDDLSDTAILFAMKDETGSFSREGTEIYESNYPDSSPYISGTKDAASVAWVRNFTHIGHESGSEATMEDIINGLATSEIMASIYKDGKFESTRLTDNDNPDIAPVTAASGDKAIVAWRNVTLGDMDNPLDFTSDYIMYSVYDGTNWSEGKCLFDGSIDRVQAVNAAMLPDGTSAIVYQITENDGDSEIILAVLDASGKVVRTLRLTDNITEDVNPQITTAEFQDGVNRFVIGWNTQTENVESAVQMVAVNREGTLYTDFSMEISNSTGMANYSNFRFAKGVDKIEDLSVIWSQPEDDDNDGTYTYNIFGTKLLMADENAHFASGKQKLITLEEGRVLDFLDSRIDPYTGKVHFVMLLTEVNEASTLATGSSEYKNDFTVKGPDYDYEDVLPGMNMPVQFTVRNDGIDAITHLTIELYGQIFEYEDENIASSETKTYLVSYSVPETIANVDFSITAQFGKTGDTCMHTGVLKLDIPDVAIYKINVTREIQRERSFRVLLKNNAFVYLKKGIHTVKLEVWNQSNIVEGSPLKTITVSEDDFDLLNSSLLSVNVTLTEDDLQQILDERGEIPEGGAWLIFRLVLEEDGRTIKDADISNDINFVNIYSLADKNGSRVSLASLCENIDGKTTVQVEAFNNSMQAINNGNIIVTLRDEKGNVLETQQTYSFSDGGSLLTIPGEESKTVRVMFNRSGYTADVSFAQISGESSLLSVLKLAGVSMEFDPNVFEYNLKTYDLEQTILTAVAENPESTISVTRDGIPVLLASPIAIPYGTTVFVITVTKGENSTTYKVRIENIREEEGENPRYDDPVNPSKPDSGKTDNFLAELTIDGIKQKDLSVTLRGKSAVVSLGTLAQNIFSGNTDAVLNIPEIPGIESYTLEVPANILASKHTGAAITISTEIGNICIPSGMLAGMKDLEGKTAGITINISDMSKLLENIKAAIGNHPIVSLTFTLNGEKIDWNNPDAPVTVSIPYVPKAEERHENIIVWYIDDNSKVVPVPNGCYNSMTDTVTFTTTHFSHYAIVYNSVYFNDVTADAWYNKAVSFIAARGITLGKGNEKYSPEDMLTRGEFIVFLMRAYDIRPDENPKDNFADAGNTYYTNYLAKAKQLGISIGVGNNIFAPNKAITRQEMFTLLYNALKVINQLPEMDNSDVDSQRKSLLDFTDNEQIAPWAREAMELLVERGIVNGNAGKLTPTRKSTRAQMAQVLYNIMTR